MSDQLPESHNHIDAQIIHSQEQGFKVLDKLYHAASAEAVFSKPVKSGDYTVILASEVSAGGGFGSGLFGDKIDKAEDQRGGGGAGGAGGSSGRPVAAIIIGPQGVRVEPVFDRTKALVGLLATITSVLVAFSQMRRGK